MQRFVASCTYAIHAHSPHLKVTVGAASLKWAASDTTDGRSVANLWADAPLLMAFERLPPATDGASSFLRGVPASQPARPTLDLYNAHFWNWMERDDGFGPCQEGASFWHADKPLVFAELPAHVKSHVERYSVELLECVLRHRFNGALFCTPLQRL